jgi:integrase
MLVRFTLRNAKEKESSVVLTVNVGIYKMINGKKSYQPFKYSTGLTVPTKYWNKKQYRVSNNKSFPEGKIINKTLDSIAYHFNEAYYIVNDQNNVITADALKKQLEINLGILSLKTDFFAAFDKFIEDSKKGERLVKGKQLANTTINHYKTTRNKLYEFNPGLSFQSIDMNFYRDFIKFLYGKGFSDNYIGSHIKRLKTFMTETFEQHHNSKYLHKEFRKLQEVTTKVALSFDEIDRLAGIDLSKKPKLERVRDVFLIGCNTALRYSDWYSIRKEHLHHENGISYLKIGATFKTGQGVIIPLNKTALSILQKYDFKLHRISNQKFNKYLKEVLTLDQYFVDKKIEVNITRGGKRTSEFVSMSELITTHTGRRTAATNMYLSGIDTLAIMKITGHNSEATFLRYIRVTEMENAKRLADNPFFNR